MISLRHNFSKSQMVGLGGAAALGLVLAGAAGLLQSGNKPGPSSITDNPICGSENGAVCSGALTKQFISGGKLATLIQDTMSRNGVAAEVTEVQAVLNRMAQNMNGASEFPEQARGNNFVIVKGPSTIEQGINLAKTATHGIFLAFQTKSASLDPKDCRLYEIRYRGTELFAVPAPVSRGGVRPTGEHVFSVPACSTTLTNLGREMTLGRT